jgi:Flp pilus assembly protein CpaB
MRRSIYLAVFVLLSAIAGSIYYVQTRQAPVLVATRDLTVGTRIEDADVSVRTINPASAGPRVLTSPEQAVGRVVSYPILQGQVVDRRQIAQSKNGALLTSGLQVPAGYRIIGLPVSPASAVGGVLKPGDLVDVMAIPTPTKGVALNEEQGAATVIIGKAVLVLGLRTEQGTQLEPPDHGLNPAGSKPASVLLAIRESDETIYSSAIANSTFVLALSID